MAITFSRVLFAAAMAALVFISAANAQFGGMPGMDGPGVGAPPAGPPPACQQLFAVRDEYQKNGIALSASNEKARSQHKPVDLVETCKLFKAFLATEVKFIRGLTDNQATCGVPPDVIKHYQEEHGKASQTGKQVCDAAEHPRQAGWVPTCEIANPAGATDRVLGPRCSEPPIEAYDPYFLGPGY